MHRRELQRLLEINKMELLGLEPPKDLRAIHQETKTHSFTGLRNKNLHNKNQETQQSSKVKVKTLSRIKQATLRQGTRATFSRLKITHKLTTIHQKHC